MKEIAPKMMHLLVNNPRLRDAKYATLAYYWKGESTSRNLTEFWSELARGKLTPAETVVRAWRKVQEENPHLRGVHYEERQKKQEVVKEELRDPVWTTIKTTTSADNSELNRDLEGQAKLNF